METVQTWDINLWSRNVAKRVYFINSVDGGFDNFIRRGNVILNACTQAGGSG